MATTSIGEIGLDLVVNKNDFEKQMSGINRLAKKAGLTLAAAFSVKKITDFGKKCLELGSDLAEVQNVVDVTFPAMTAQVDKFAQSAATSFGLSETMAKKFTGTFGAMAKAFGFSEAAAYEMSTTLTGLAGDVASFYNISQDEAYTKLKSVFTGETESLKDLGVVMTQTALDSYALANGFGKTTSAMTEAEKVALRYQFVQDQLSAATGDFARTSDSWANQCRILSLQVQSIMATIGQGLINLFTPIIKIVNVVIGKIATLANAFKSFTELITGNKSSGSGSVANPISDLGNAAGAASDGLSDATGAADGLSDATKSVGSAAKKAAKEMRALMGFDKINRLDKPDTSSDTGSGVGAGMGMGGALGSEVDFGSLADGETVIDDVDNKFTKMFQNIKELAQPATDALKRLWNEGLRELGSFTWDTLRDFWNNFLKPLGEWMLSDNSGLPRFFDITNNLLTEINWGKLKSSLGDFYTSLQNVAKFRWNTAMDFYDSFMKPLSVWTFSEALPRLVDCFTRFNNDVAWESIRTALDNVWRSLEPFAENIGEGLLWFYENVLTPLGTWVANEVVPRFLETVRIAIDGLNIIIEALRPLFQWFWDSVLQPLAQWTGGIFLQVWDRINDSLKRFSDWCAKNPGIIQNITTVIGAFFAAFKITKLISDIGSLISSFGSITGAVTKFGGLIKSVLNPWTLALAGIITVGVLLYKNWDVIKEKAIEIWGAIKSWFDATTKEIGNFFERLWQGISTTFQSIGEWFKEKFETARDNIYVAFASIGDWFSEKYKSVTNAFKDVGEWFKTQFETAYKNVSSAFSNAGTFFGGVWKNIKGAFGNISKWFHDEFSKAWQKVKDVFSTGGKVFVGITDGIAGTFKTVVNGLINGINRVIAVPFNKIESALASLRNWSVDIGPWTLTTPFSWLPSVSAPQIPLLAKGGYVKANTPQLAMIGDNRHYGEIVAPEDKMQAMVDEAVRGAVNGGGVTREELESIINRAVMRIVAALAEMGFYLDSEQMAKAARTAAQSIDTRFNPVEMA